MTMESPRDLQPGGPGRHKMSRLPCLEAAPTEGSSSREAWGPQRPLTGVCPAVTAGAGEPLDRDNPSAGYVKEWRQRPGVSEGKETCHILSAAADVAAGDFAAGARAPLNGLCPRKSSLPLLAAEYQYGRGRPESPASEDDLLPKDSCTTMASHTSKHSKLSTLRLGRHQRRRTADCRRTRCCLPFEDQSSHLGSSRSNGCRCEAKAMTEEASWTQSFGHQSFRNHCKLPSRLTSSSPYMRALSHVPHRGSPDKQPQFLLPSGDNEEFAKDACLWNEERRGGWATLWLCPRTPLFSLQRMAIGFLFTSCCAYFMCILSVVSDQFYDPKKGPFRLHDRVHDQILSSHPLWLATPFVVDVLTVGLLVVTMLRHMLFIPFSVGFLIGQRLLFLLGSMYVLRGLAMVITTVPPSKPHCDPPRVHKVSDLFCFSLQQCFNLRSECTGMIISGHSITTCCSMAVWLLYGDAPAVCPFKNLRAAFQYVSSELRMYCRKRRHKRSRPADETWLDAEQVHGSKAEEDIEASLSREEEVSEKALLPACVETRPVTVALPEEELASVDKPSPANMQRQQRKRQHGHTEKAEATNVLLARRLDNDNRKTVGGALQPAGREIGLNLAMKQLEHHGALDAAAAAPSNKETEAAQKYERLLRGTHAERKKKGVEDNNDNAEERDSVAVGGDPPKHATKAGSCSNWSTEIEVEESTKRTRGCLHGSRRPLEESPNDEQQEDCSDTGERRQSACSVQRGEDHNAQRHSLLLQSHRYGDQCLVWRYIRDNLLTASMLRIICLVVGCTNLLFIIMSFNHYTVDVFMAINFTLGAWGFYHFVVALLWDERLTTECAAVAVAAAAACECGQSPHQPRWLHLTDTDSPRQDVAENETAYDGADPSTSADAHIKTRQRQQQGCAGNAATCSSSSTSACCCTYDTKEWERASKKGPTAGGENSDSLTEASTATATPGMHAPPVPPHAPKNTHRDHHSTTGSSRNRMSYSASPVRGFGQKNDYQEANGGFSEGRRGGRERQFASNGGLLDCSEAAGSRVSSKSLKHCQLYKESGHQNGEAEAGPRLPILLRDAGKVTSGDASDHRPDSDAHLCPSNDARDAVVSVSRRTASAHKNQSHVFCAEILGWRRHRPCPICSEGSAGGRSSSDAWRNCLFSEFGVFAFMRSSSRTLHLPLLQPAVNAIRCVEGM